MDNQINRDTRAENFGLKSIVIISFLPLPLLVFTFFRDGWATSLHDGIVFFAINLLMGFFLYKIIVIKDNHIEVISILNPFAKRSKIHFEVIDNVTIKTNSFGGTVSITFNVLGMEKKFMYIMVGFERKRLMQSLKAKKLIVDTWDL